MPNEVLYYSLTGHTRRLAEQIADQLGVEAREMTEEANRLGFWGMMKSIWQTLARRPVILTVPRIDPASTGVLFIGGPLWVGQISAPLATVLKTLREKDMPVALFMMHRGEDDGDAEAEFEQIVGRPPVAFLDLSEDQLDAEPDPALLEEFILKALSALEPKSAA